jgi:hypothetical protein
MSGSGTLFALAVMLLFASCRQAAETAIPPKQAAIAERTSGAEQRDLYVQLATYYQSLISTRNITPDTSWFANVDSADRSPEKYSLIFRSQLGDDPEKFAEFPFKDLQFRYHEGDSQDFFLVRGQRFRETVYTSGNAFPVSSIRRFHHKGGSYLVFNGHLQQYNGYGDRINFNYFFDLSSGRVVADMYENNWASVENPFLYGDLHDDCQLDRIRFDGIMYPQWGCPDSVFSNNELRCPDTITVTAETYRNKKWQPLRDRSGKPYFIELQAYEDRDTAILGAHHWMRELKSPY